MNRNRNTYHLVLTALFVAFILLFGFTPVGMIPLVFINVTILCIPVIIGTILLGVKTGMFLGFCFGTVSALSAFGIVGTPSTLAGEVVAASPVLALVMCYVPRLLVPLTVHLVYRMIPRVEKLRPFQIPAAAVVGSLTNTVFYLGLMLLIYIALGIDYAGLLAMIGGTGLIAGSCETIVAAIVATPVVSALQNIQK